MKKTIIVTALFALTSGAFAQQTTSTDTDIANAQQATSDWLRSLQEQQANTINEAVNPVTGKTELPQASRGKIYSTKDFSIPGATEQLTKTGFPKEPGVHIYSIEDYPAPDAVKQSILRGAQKSKQGISTVSPERVLTEAQVQEKLAQWSSKPLDVLKKSLTFVPAELSSTPLATGKLADAGTVGTTLSNGLSTGLTRTYQVPDVGFVTFDEVDYPSSPHLRIMLVKESFNTEINGIPAIASSARTTDGRGSASLRWFTPARSYDLHLITDNGSRLEQDQQMLKVIASQMVEHK